MNQALTRHTTSFVVRISMSAASMSALVSVALPWSSVSDVDAEAWPWRSVVALASLVAVLGSLSQSYRMKKVLVVCGLVICGSAIGADSVIWAGGYPTTAGTGVSLAMLSGLVLFQIAGVAMLLPRRQVAEHFARERAACDGTPELPARQRGPRTWADVVEILARLFRVLTALAMAWSAALTLAFVSPIFSGLLAIFFALGWATVAYCGLVAIVMMQLIEPRERSWAGPVAVVFGPVATGLLAASVLD